MAFFQGATELSQLASCFELILGVTVKAVQGNQLYLESIGKLESFEMVARLLDFLSNFKLRPPPLEVRRESWDSFPDLSSEIDPHLEMRR